MGDERAQAAYQREELAWAAGFWDGEGSCGCYRRNDGRTRKASNSYLRASVNQKDREVLDRFLAAVGLGKVYGPYSGTTAWAWQLHGEQVREVFEKLWPWLSRIKREQFTAAAAKHDAREFGNLNDGRPCPPGCTCGRHHWQHEDGLTEQQLRRRAQQREATRRYRAKKKESA